MSKLKKSLQKFSKKEQKIIAEITRRVLDKDFKGLNVTRLKGSASIYRVKKGRIRIIYQVEKNDVQILAIERRSEKTYRGF